MSEDEGKLVRWPQNHGKPIDLRVLPETRKAIRDELAHMADDLGDKVPKFATREREPSAMDLINEIVHAYFERPPAWRDEFRLSGRESLRRHQRSPTPFPLGPPESVAGLAGPADVAGDGGDDIVTPRPLGSAGKRVRRGSKDGTRDRKAIRDHR